MGIVWVLLVGTAGFALVKIGSTIRKNNPNIRAFQWKYQSTTLLLGLSLFGISGSFGDWVSVFGNVAAPVRDMDFLGATKSDTWATFGLTFAFVMGAVTLVVVWLQSGKRKKISFRLVAANLPLVILFSLANALTEELIFRVTLIQGFAGSAPSWVVALLSAALFGGIHYFGQPGRIPGVLMAGFMGCLLTYSIIQTGGIFWAWLIHFVQDVLILSIVFAGESERKL